ncbi:MAG: cupin domain-containing protein [Nitrospinales bacterium]
MNIVKVRDRVAFSSEKMKKVSLFDSDRFFCDIYCLEPGQKQKIHAHADSDKVYYVLEGKGSVTVGEEERGICAGEITMAPAGEVHGVANGSGDPLVLLVFMAPKPQ